MAGKHWLTLIHCVLAAILVPRGMTWAARVALDQPVAGFVAMLAVPALMALIATRVAWAAGYVAGRQHAVRPNPTLQQTAASSTAPRVEGP